MTGRSGRLTFMSTDRHSRAVRSAESVPPPPILHGIFCIGAHEPSINVWSRRHVRQKRLISHAGALRLADSFPSDSRTKTAIWRSRATSSGWPWSCY